MWQWLIGHRSEVRQQIPDSRSHQPSWQHSHRMSQEPCQLAAVLKERVGRGNALVAPQEHEKGARCFPLVQESDIGYQWGNIFNRPFNRPVNMAYLLNTQYSWYCYLALASNTSHQSLSLSLDQRQQLQHHQPLAAVPKLAFSAGQESHRQCLSRHTRIMYDSRNEPLVTTHQSPVSSRHEPLVASCQPLVTVTSHHKVTRPLWSLSHQVTRPRLILSKSMSHRIYVYVYDSMILFTVGLSQPMRNFSLLSQVVSGMCDVVWPAKLSSY